MLGIGGVEAGGNGAGARSGTTFWTVWSVPLYGLEACVSLLARACAIPDTFILIAHSLGVSRPKSSNVRAGGSEDTSCWTGVRPG
eukprot:15439622-Alexandrium_andersonii.AAC.1